VFVPSEKWTKVIITVMVHWKYLRLIAIDRNIRNNKREKEEMREDDASGTTN